MSLLKRREINLEIEEKILVGMIVSDSFCRDIAKVVGKDTLQVPYIARAVGWCKDYYYRYKEAPGAHISDIYEVEREKLEENDARAIATILSRLSEETERGGFNEDYLKDRAFEYFRTRHITLATEKAKALMEMGRGEDAERVLMEYRKAALLTSGWVNPFDQEAIDRFFSNENAKKDFLFRLPGDLGDFIGDFERNSLVAFLAPTKRGKTFWLVELGVHSTFCRLKTVTFSLEMNMQQMSRRLYRRLTAMSKETRDYIFPCFDCVKNQDGSCNKASRTNAIRLLDAEGKKPRYSQEMKYATCTACRGAQGFVPGSWYRTEKISKMSQAKASRIIQSSGRHFGSDLRMLSYPSFSASVEKLRSDLAMLEETEGFVPDVIVIDYADILAPEDHRDVGRDAINRTWKTLKRMGDELHCCVVTASQANRASFDKKNVVQTDASDDIRKISNSTLVMAINQTPQEKREGVVRISKIAARDEDFDQYESVLVLQQLALGQVFLDSCLQRNENIEKQDDDSVLW